MADDKIGEELRGLSVTELEKLFQPICNDLAKITSSPVHFIRALYQLQVLTRDQRDECLSQKTPYLQSCAAYDIVLLKNKGQKVMEALHTCEDLHCIAMIQTRFKQWKSSSTLNSPSSPLPPPYPLMEFQNGLFNGTMPLPVFTDTPAPIPATSTFSSPPPAHPMTDHMTFGFESLVNSLSNLSAGTVLDSDEPSSSPSRVTNGNKQSKTLSTGRVQSSSKKPPKSSTPSCVKEKSDSVADDAAQALRLINKLVKMIEKEENEWESCSDDDNDDDNGQSSASDSELEGEKKFSAIERMNAKNPTALSTERCYNMSLSHNKTRGTYLKQKILKMAVACGNRVIAKDSHFYYYEMTVVYTGVDENGDESIAIGLATKDFDYRTFPGWDAWSYGYHGDDGEIHTQSTSKKYGPKFGTGDTVGCCVDFIRHQCFFTLNGLQLDTAFENIPSALYPVVAADYFGAKMDVNFGQEQFLFNVTKFMEGATRIYMDLFHLKSREIQPKCLNPDDAHGEMILSERNCRASYGMPYFNKRIPRGVRADGIICNVNNRFYYEVSIVNQGRTGKIGIGLATSSWDLSKHPGWDSHSFGYHGDDGMTFRSGPGTGKKYGPKYTTGDVIGCGVNFLASQCYFTKNGKNLGVAFKFLPPNLYPAIALNSVGAVVDVNFGQKPFMYKISK